MDTLTVLCLAAPLLAAALLWLPASRPLGLRLAPWAALPALLLALAAPIPYEVDLPWLLLGTRLGLDETGRVFLLFTALIWLAAGWFARAWLADDARRHIFAGFFLLTQAGNLGVCLVLDAAGFYGFFALMSLAAYGLIVHDRSPPARRAGRVYLVLALAGEMLILSGLLLVADATHMPAAVACLILGFGVKTGLPLLHVSLPLAYAATPIPGAAVLAGAMINAGLLGWLRFLPLGEAALPGAGSALMLAGLLAIFYGVAVGLTQRQPGALLAYSSISQMGYFSVALGAGLLAPELWPLLLPVVVLYALHHALAKGALFLGVGVAERCGASRRVMLGLALPALALAGAPLTSGMLVKGGLKAGLADLPAPWAELLAALLPLAALGTALLMVRLLWLVGRAAPAQRTSASVVGLLAPWLVLLLALAGLAWMMAPQSLITKALSLGAQLDAAWPPLAAAALCAIALRLRWRAPMLPPGDVLVPLLRGLAYLRRRAPALPQWRIALPSGSRAAARPPQLESQLRAWGTAGALWLALLAAVIALLAGTG
ncbi:MAG: complex I subunit 5 family protein [Gammaproteobacteria bacterium]|nr:complex I subunit 5 family protein [Gammaproteobacteria bacterium]